MIDPLYRTFLGVERPGLRWIHVGVGVVELVVELVPVVRDARNSRKHSASVPLLVFYCSAKQFGFHFDEQ